MTAKVRAAGREAALRRLELRITRRLDGLLHGDHQGLVLAAGTELGEAREYRVGDDVRRMDWSLTARTTVPHVRDTIAERELEAWLVVDRTPSMDFGTALCEKSETALGAVAAFGFLNNRAGNRTGAVLVGCDGDGSSVVLPARSGRDAVFGLLHTLSTRPGGPGDLAGALATADRVARRRGLVVVVSDFLDPPSWGVPLRRLTSRHQVVAVEVLDPREDVLPPVGLLTLVDPETGRRIEVQTDSKKLRRRFETAASARRSAVAKELRAAGARHVVLSTERDWFLDLVKAVEGWRRRR